jgi:hypothetical protein
MGAFTFHPWTDLGGALAGSAGPLTLFPKGSLIAGSLLTLQVDFLPAEAPAWYVVGLAALGAPFKSGILWPEPDAFIGPLVVNPFGGKLILATNWPAGLPHGFSFWAQAWWQDPAGPQGWAASSGIRGVQP